MVRPIVSARSQNIPQAEARPVAGLICQECKKVIAPDAQFCPHCRAAILRRYCPGCAKLIPDTAAFCPYCGTSGTNPVKKVRVSSSMLILVFVCLLLMTFSIVLIYTSRSEAYKSNVNKIPTERPVESLGRISEGVPNKSYRQTMAAAVKPAVSNEKSDGSEIVGSRLNLEGHRLLREGRYEDAIRVLRRAVQSFPTDTRDMSYIFAVYNLGHSLRRTGRPQEAIPLLQQCIRFDKSNQKFQEELKAAQRDVWRNPS
jgi:tetratricopeptide (TPR) repeat protein